MVTFGVKRLVAGNFLSVTVVVLTRYSFDGFATLWRKLSELVSSTWLSFVPNRGPKTKAEVSSGSSDVHPVSLGHRVVLSATRPLLGLGKKSHRGYHYLPTTLLRSPPVAFQCVLALQAADYGGLAA